MNRQRDLVLPVPGTDQVTATTTLIEAFADTLARNPGMATRLLRTHVDDGAGACAACSGVVRTAWPCVIAGITARACDF